MRGSVVKRLLIIVPVVVLGLTLVSLFMPAQRVSIEGVGKLSFETTVTLSVGSEVAYASPDFPAIGSSATTADTSGNAVTVIMPSGIVAGNLLIAFVSHDTNATITQSGGTDWTRIVLVANGSAVQMAVFAKVAAGGDTLALTDGGDNQDTAIVTVRITGHGVSDVSTDITLGTAATGTTNAPNPPVSNPGTSKDYLWIEFAASDDDDNTATYWSTNYSAVAQAESAQSFSSCMASVGQRSLAASSEDPGNMALAASEEWIAQTLAIPPVAAEPSITVDPTSYGFGTVSASSTTSTTTVYFTIDNTSTILTDHTISVTTSTWSGGVGWTHSDTATAGADTAGLLANKGGDWGTGDIIVKYDTPNYIYDNCPANTGYSFGLKLLAPTSFSDGAQKQIIVRITAVAG